jgi:hypothetical protein
MISKVGAGPEPIPHQQLNVENLRDAIKFATSPTAKQAAQRMAEQIKNEVRLPPPLSLVYRRFIFWS